MFEKITFEYRGETIELNCRRMPQMVKGRIFDRLVKSRVDGIPSSEVMAENRCEFICATFVDDAGKAIFKRAYPEDQSTWGDDSVLRQYPQLWELDKFVLYATQAENFQSPKMEQVAKNSTATTDGDS